MSEDKPLRDKRVVSLQEEELDKILVDVYFVLLRGREGSGLASLWLESLHDPYVTFLHNAFVNSYRRQGIGRMNVLSFVSGLGELGEECQGGALMNEVLEALGYRGVPLGHRSLHENFLLLFHLNPSLRECLKNELDKELGMNTNE